MGQPSDPGSDPAERRRWTIYECPKCFHREVFEGATRPSIRCPWEAVRHGPTKMPGVLVVPAGGLVAELEAERAKTRQLELDLLRQDSEACKLRDEALIQATKNAARAELAEKHRDEWRALAYEIGDVAERSAVPTATVSAMREALEEIASRAPVTMQGEGVDQIGVLRSYSEAVDIARAALAEHPRPGDGERG